MKIAITSQNRHEITGHAGRCRKFWIYDVAEDSSEEKIKGKELLELPKEQSLHEHREASHPVLDHAKVLITGGMGQGMRNRLANRNIRGIVTEETDPDKAVHDFLNGSLREKESSHEGKESSHEDADHHHDGHGCGCSHHSPQEVQFFPNVP